jgi:hypothetical protein
MWLRVDLYDGNAHVRAMTSDITRCFRLTLYTSVLSSAYKVLYKHELYLN